MRAQTKDALLIAGVIGGTTLLLWGGLVLFGKTKATSLKVGDRFTADLVDPSAGTGGRPRTTPILRVLGAASTTLTDPARGTLIFVAAVDDPASGDDGKGPIPIFDRDVVHLQGPRTVPRALPTPVGPVPVPRVPLPVPFPVPPPAPKGPFSDLPVGTLVNRVGFPTGFFEPKWRIVSKSDVPTLLRPVGWSYVVVAVPAPLIGVNAPTTISELEVSSLA